MHRCLEFLSVFSAMQCVLVHGGEAVLATSDGPFVLRLDGCVFSSNIKQRPAYLLEIVEQFSLGDGLYKNMPSKTKKRMLVMNLEALEREVA